MELSWNRRRGVVVVEAAQDCRIGMIVKDGQKSYLWESALGENTSLWSVFAKLDLDEKWILT